MSDTPQAAPQERETREIVLPSGTKAKLLAYLTGREIRRIERAFYNSINVSGGEHVNGRMVSSPAANVTVGQCQQDKDDEIIKCAVVELDGSRDNVWERVLDLRAGDWEMIVAESKNLQTPTETK